MNIDEAASYAFSLLDDIGNEICRLDDDVQTFIFVYSAQGILDNGGFQYFFENDFPGCPSYSLFVDAYRAIGCSYVADQLSKVINLLGGKDINLDSVERNRMLDLLKSQIDPISDLVCGDELVWQKLAIFVDERAKKFGVA